MSKRYYWLRLNENFFERDEIKVIENMPNGEKYINFYLKLLLKSINNEGKLMFRNVIPYTPEMLSSITNTDIDTVRVATNLFEQLGLMEKLDDGALFMAETQNMIGSETDSAKRMREKRDRDNKQLLPPSQSDEDVQNSDIEIKIDKEIDKDIYLNIYSDVITYLNSKSSKNYKSSSKKTKSLIKARTDEGFTLDDFKKVIDTKVIEWGNDANMSKYLRPETLFGTKFEGYLNQSSNSVVTKRNDEYEPF